MPVSLCFFKSLSLNALLYFFLDINMLHMVHKKGHGNTSLIPPYPWKRATLTHPPYSHFFKKKTAAWNLLFQNRRKATCILFRRTDTQPPKQRFFLFRCGWLLFHRSLPILELEVSCFTQSKFISSLIIANIIAIFLSMFAQKWEMNCYKKIIIHLFGPGKSIWTDRWN